MGPATLKSCDATLSVDNNMYIFKEDLALHYPQELICHKTTESENKNVSIFNIN